MRIAFNKITQQPKHFILKQDNLTLECDIFRKMDSVFVLKGSIIGEIMLECDLSGEEFIKKIQQKLVLYISDGVWNMQSQSKLDSFDVIEFFDGFIDIGYLFESEIQLIKLDYHIKE